jgi:hypothetical protein
MSTICVSRMAPSCQYNFIVWSEEYASYESVMPDTSQPVMPDTSQSGSIKWIGLLLPRVLSKYGYTWQEALKSASVTQCCLVQLLELQTRNFASNPTDLRLYHPLTSTVMITFQEHLRDVHDPSPTLFKSHWSHIRSFPLSAGHLWYSWSHSLDFFLVRTYPLKGSSITITLTDCCVLFTNV